LQTKFDLPVFEGTAYSEAYLTFLSKLIHLRALSISETRLRALWHLEKKLLGLLHVNSTGSPTWFLDACGQKRHVKRRLLLSDYDLGVELPSGSLQLGLDFDTSPSLPELFAGREMGEDSLRILDEYLKTYARIQTDVNREIPLVLTATKWATRMK
jgi:hypothetical protein